jgi:hypothetical protein
MSGGNVRTQPGMSLHITQGHNVAGVQACRDAFLQDLDTLLWDKSEAGSGNLPW